MKWIILLLLPYIGCSQCEEPFKKTINVHYTYTEKAEKGGGIEWALVGDISPLTIGVGMGVSVAKEPVYKLPAGDSMMVNFRLYTKWAYRIYRWDYKLSLNIAAMAGFDDMGAFVAPGARLFMPAGINTALSLEPYYLIRDKEYLIQVGLHFKFR